MSDERALLKEGIAAARSGDQAHALAVLQQVIEQFPRSIDGWLWLGLVVEDSIDAEECFNRVLVLDPKHALARNYLKALKEGHAPELPPEPAQPAPMPPSELDRFRQSLGVSATEEAAPARPVARLAPEPAASPAKPIEKPRVKPTRPTRRFGPRLKLSTGRAVTIGLLGVWGMALLCGVPMVFALLALGGGGAGSIAAVATLVPSPTPGAETPVDVRATTTPVATGVAPAATPADAPAAPAIEPALAAGRALVQAGRFSEARAALLPVVAAAPNHVEAATLLAQADIGALVTAYDAEPIDLTPLIARRDIDAAIALAPSQGDLYLLRAFVAAEALRRGDSPQTRETTAAAARADLDAATTMGISGSTFNAWLPLVQARIGRCDDGYKTATQALGLGGRLPQDRAWLQYGAALNAYCRARYDEAGAYARQASDTLAADFPQARELEILSLQARKRAAEALKKADAWFSAEPIESARRLALHAFLLYETGDRGGAQADLDRADALVRLNDPLHAYTQGRLTVDTGGDNGWDSVRYAVMALDPALAFLREQWGATLAEAGQDPAPLADPASVPDAAYPRVALNGAPPPNPGRLSSLETGSAPVVLSQVATGLHFQAVTPLGLGEVSGLRVAALGLQVGAAADKIEVALWDQVNDRWVAQTLTTDGFVEVKQPSRFVSAEGDVYASVRLTVAEHWSVRRLAVTIATSTDGQTQNFGFDPNAPGDIAALTPLEQSAALVVVDQLDRATAVLTAALAATTQPADRVALLDQLARVALLRGDAAAATEHAIAALAIESQPERHFVLAVALDLSGDVTAARREYELAVAPGNPLPDVSRGLAEGRIQQLTR